MLLSSYLNLVCVVPNTFAFDMGTAAADNDFAGNFLFEF